MHSAAHTGSSVHDTHATLVSPHLSSVLSSCRIQPLIPRRVTGAPVLSKSFFVPSPSATNGAPPPHNWYMSGVQIVPSRSNAINFGGRWTAFEDPTRELIIAPPDWIEEIRVKDKAATIIWSTLLVHQTCIYAVKCTTVINQEIIAMWMVGVSVA